MKASIIKMIKKANELTTTATKIRVLIAGYPGVGKSTCALSAPKPLIVVRIGVS
jgi:tRNA U34 5-carboxymethylaminomethyl modifying GTPase MnmE/TrmE